MNKNIPAIVATVFLSAAAVPAYAASTVTLYGVLDTGINMNNNSGGKHLYNMDSTSGPFGSRWGIKGNEDLGGGLSAVFTLESGINAATGALAQGGTMFGRQAFVGLSSTRLGTLTLGRQYDSMSDFMGDYEFSLAWYGSGAAHPGDLDNGGRTYRENNSLKYMSPTFNGFKFGATASLGGQSGSVSRASGYSLGAKYSLSSFAASVVYELYKNPSSIGAILNSNANAKDPSVTAAYGSINSGYLAGAGPASSWQVIAAGGQYLVGNATIGAVWTNTRYNNIGNFGGKSAVLNSAEINGGYRLTPFVFVGLEYNYTKGNAITGDIGDQTYHQVSAIADYLLSKRTDVYILGTFQHASGVNSRGQRAVADISLQGDSSNANQTFVRVGLRHLF